MTVSGSGAERTPAELRGGNQRPAWTGLREDGASRQAGRTDQVQSQRVEGGLGPGRRSVRRTCGIQHGMVRRRAMSRTIRRPMWGTFTFERCCWKGIRDILSRRAEPILQRIKEDRTRVVSPSFDNIKFDTLEIEEYPLSAQGFDWELWCRNLNPPKSWWTQRNSTAPIR